MEDIYWFSELSVKKFDSTEPIIPNNNRKNKQNNGGNNENF